MSDPEITYDLGLLAQSMSKWRESAALRTVYQDIFRAMAARCAPGRTLELGAGIGVAKESIPDLVTSDLVKTDYVDRAASAYAIPAEDWANLVAMDTLHHLQRPFDFFASAAAALQPAGRIVLMEPAATPLGLWFYRTLHHEPCRPRLIVPPFEFAADEQGEFANMGMGVGLFEHHRAETEQRLRAIGLRVREVSYRDGLAYPATGGFSQRALLPAPVLRALLAAEQALPRFVMRWVGLRMLIVIEKTVVPEPGTDVVR